MAVAAARQRHRPYLLSGINPAAGMAFGMIMGVVRQAGWTVRPHPTQQQQPLPIIHSAAPPRAAKNHYCATGAAH